MMTIIQHRKLFPRIVVDPFDIHNEEDDNVRESHAARDLFGEEQFKRYKEREQRDIDGQLLRRVSDYIDMAQEQIRITTSAMETHFNMRNELVRQQLQSLDIALLMPIHDVIITMSAVPQQEPTGAIRIEANESQPLTWLDMCIDLANNFLSILFKHLLNGASFTVSNVLALEH